MSTAALALVAAVVALVAAGVVARDGAPHAPRVGDGGSTQGLLVIGEQMDALARELATTVEKVREDAVRARIVESLGQALDLDEVLARCAEAAASLRGVAGAIVAVEVDGVPLSALPASPPSLTTRSAPERSAALRTAAAVRAVGISYHYPAGDERADGHAVGHRRAGRVGERPPGVPDRVRARRGAAGRGQRLPDPRGHRPPRRARRSRRPGSAAPVRPAAGRRRADRARQPAGAPRDARARGRARAPPRAQAGRLRPRPRRLQAHEQPRRADRRRRPSRRGRGSCSARRSAPPASPSAAAATSSP